MAYRSPSISTQTSPMIERRFKTRSPAGTLAIAQNIAELLLPTPKLVLLRGELGAGKTTLVKGIAATLNVAAPEDVTSPTFTLIHEYRSPTIRLYHLDLYRLETERELLALGLEEMAAESDALVLVEWGDKFPSLRSRADVEISIEPGPDQPNDRLFLIRATGPEC